MRADLRAILDDLVAGLSPDPAAIDRAIDAALAHHDRVRPRLVVVDRPTVAAAGIETAGIDPPVEWVDGASRLIGAEWPIGRNPPARAAVTLSRSPTGPVFLAPVEAERGAVVRLTITVPHRVDGTVDTLPAGERTAVARLAAAHLLDAAATAHAGDVEPTMQIQGSAPSQSVASRTYAARAEEFRRAYAAETTAPTETAPLAAGTEVVFRPRATDGGARLFRRG